MKNFQQKSRRQISLSPQRVVPDVLPPLPEDIPQPAQEVEAGEAIEAVPEIVVDGPAEAVDNS